MPGITRGNHYHTRKAERFAVIKGKARIELRKIGEIVAIQNHDAKKIRNDFKMEFIKAIS